MVKETVYDMVFDAQAHFRVLLDAMARPGSIQVLNDVDIVPPHGLHRVSALVGFALLNGDVTFHVVSADSDVADYLMVNTASLMTSADEADFIFVKGNLRTPAILAAKVGSLRYPEEGATVIVDVDKISDVACDGAVALTLSGPGVLDTKTIYVAGLDVAILADFVSQNAEFPTGIDLILTDGDDALSCVPRTAKLNWE
jgi:alpha-D-ribose 1-methylphosphonate 5-triphosphate synthase subunit PhnH